MVMGAAAPANIEENAFEPQMKARQEPQREIQPGPQMQPAAQASPDQTATPVSANIERLQSAVLQALSDGNQRILVSMLGAGQWAVEGNEVVVRVTESQTVVDMSLGADARRLAVASASGVLGRPVKLKVVAGAAVAAAPVKSNGTSGGGGRSRAEQDSVVRRLQEKFGAEIRTVIDYKERR